MLISLAVVSRARSKLCWAAQIRLCVHCLLTHCSYARCSSSKFENAFVVQRKATNSMQQLQSAGTVAALPKAKPIQVRSDQLKGLAKSKSGTLSTHSQVEQTDDCSQLCDKAYQPVCVLRGYQARERPLQPLEELHTQRRSE